MQDKQAWAAWLSVDGVGRETFAKLLDWSTQRQLTLAQLWQRPPAKVLSTRQLKSLEAFQRQHSIASYWRSLRQQQVAVVTINDTAYPAKLRQIYDPPWLLFVKGQWPKAPIRVGVVGTRRNTNYGRQATEKIVRELVLHQATIVSGFMYGIDTIAHQQAVAAGGQTIAVLGYGFDHVGPQSHRQLYQAWLQRPDQVTFISEYPPTRQPKPGLFPLRNRIVAGLSDGVVVVEAAARSGSLITAQLAIDDGRPVCAVPGSIFSRYSQGTKELVNQGACLVSSGYQVLAELGYSLAEPAPASGQASLPAAASPQAQKILQELAASPQTAEDLLQLLQIPMRELTLQITELEILGLIQRQGGLLQLAKNDHEL